MRLTLFSFLACWSAMVPAQTSTMFVCTDSEGVRTYQNSDEGKNCLPLNLNPITVVPAPKSAPSAGPMSNASRGPGSTLQSPYDFEAKTDRLKILQDELRAETSKLESLQAEYNNGQPERLGSEKNYQRYQERVARLAADIQLTEDNIKILKRDVEKLLSQ